jgi:hypothetical protein
MSVALTDHEAARESTRVFDNFEAYSGSSSNLVRSRQ